MNINNPNDWLNVKAGSTVTLSDEESLLESKKAGRGLKPLDCTVERVLYIRELDRRITWVMVQLSSIIPLVLMVKIVDSNVDYRVYFQIPEIAPATRKQNIDNGNHWMFKDPGTTDFKLGALEFNGDVSYNANGNNITYLIKPQGSLNGLVTESPARSGVKDLLATIVEYSTKDETKSPELLVLELGNKFNEDGGEITYFFGAPVNANEIQVLSL